jgi:hypothetical protein
MNELALIRKALYDAGIIHVRADQLAEKVSAALMAATPRLFMDYDLVTVQYLEDVIAHTPHDIGWHNACESLFDRIKALANESAPESEKP